MATTAAVAVAVLMPDPLWPPPICNHLGMVRPQTGWPLPQQTYNYQHPLVCLPCGTSLTRGEGKCHPSSYCQNGGAFTVSRVKAVGVMV